MKFISLIIALLLFVSPYVSGSEIEYDGFPLELNGLDLIKIVAVKNGELIQKTEFNGDVVMFAKDVFTGTEENKKVYQEILKYKIYRSNMITSYYLTGKNGAKIRMSSFSAGWYISFELNGVITKGCYESVCYVNLCSNKENIESAAEMAQGINMINENFNMGILSFLDSPDEVKEGAMAKEMNKIK